MNEIINIRIDDRLIHGQVATFWTNMLKVNRIVVVDNEVAKDEVTKSILRMAAPSNVNTSIINEAKAIDNFLKRRYKNQRVLIVVKSPRVLLNLIEAGVEISSINIGNMSKRDNTQQIAKSISITNSEHTDFAKLKKHGVELYTQMVPSDNKSDFLQLLETYGGE